MFMSNYPPFCIRYFSVLLAKSGLFTTRKGLSCKVVFMGCASSKQFKRAPHHEDASILAKETTCKEIYTWFATK